MKTNLLSENAKMPCYKTKGAACADVFLPADVTIPAHTTVKVPLDLSFDLPEGSKIVMYPRSSLLVKYNVMQPVSIIDEDYHGNVHVPLHNLNDEPVTFNKGDRVAQIELAATTDYVLTEWNIEEAERDQNGFGGTGK